VKNRVKQFRLPRWIGGLFSGLSWLVVLVILNEQTRVQQFSLFLSKQGDPSKLTLWNY
jgi:hypothetical protein